MAMSSEQNTHMHLLWEVQTMKITIAQLEETIRDSSLKESNPQVVHVPYPMPIQTPRAILQNPTPISSTPTSIPHPRSKVGHNCLPFLLFYPHFDLSKYTPYFFKSFGLLT